MDGEAFYEEFKAALYYFGLSWGQKDQVTVFVMDGCLWFRHGTRSVRLELPAEKA